ncbi:MAG: phospholipase D family protein [Nitrospira sp.]|nr:phospholipase D family protein [Nitrospira sp.]
MIWLLAAGLLGPNWEVSATSVEVWYGPEDRPLEQLVRMYDRAKRYIFVAVYGVTSPLTVKALVAAKRRGVDVRLLTDRERLNDPKQRTALSALREAGIPIKINQHDGLMHLKQTVIDDEINASGSMNQTTGGNRYNDERLDIIRDHAVTVKAREKFLSMWKDQERFQEWK